MMRGHRRVRVDDLVRSIGTMARHGRQVIRQTRARVVGAETRTSGKIVSVFEPWAQIIRKGKLHRPTEFGGGEGTGVRGGHRHRHRGR